MLELSMVIASANAGVADRPTAVTAVTARNNLFIEYPLNREIINDQRSNPHANSEFVRSAVVNAPHDVEVL